MGRRGENAINSSKSVKGRIHFLSCRGQAPQMISEWPAKYSMSDTLYSTELAANGTTNVTLINRKTSHFGNLGSVGLIEKGPCVHYP